MKNVIRRLKKRMGFDKDPEEVKTPEPKVKKVKETKIEKLERELAELQEEEAAIAEEPLEELKKVEEQKSPTIHEVLHNHEQRLLQMESKWFRLGGI